MKTPQPKPKKVKNELFEDAMKEFSKLAEISLEALHPFKNHSAACSTSCPSCRLRDYYWRVSDMVTVFKP